MPQTTFTIGRNPDSDFHLNDSDVSRRHAELVVGSNGVHHLTDCGSANGTFVRVKGKWVRIRQQEIGLSDPIRFGPVETTVAQLKGNRDPAPKSRDERSVKRDPLTGMIIGRS